MILVLGARRRVPTRQECQVPKARKRRPENARKRRHKGITPLSCRRCQFVMMLLLYNARARMSRKAGELFGKSSPTFLLRCPHRTPLLILACALRPLPLLFAPFTRPRRRSQTSPPQNLLNASQGFRARSRRGYATKSLPPGGRWHFRKKMAEGARATLSFALV